MTRKPRFLVLAFVAVASTCALWPQEATAQRRAVPRATGRTVARPSGSYGPYYRPHYRPYYYYHPYYYYGRPYYPGFYGSFYWGAGYYYPYYPYYQYPYGYRRPVYDRTGSARLQVTPRNAEVFVDGYFVGVVDDFDGTLQRLHVEAGEHELQFHLEGYRTVRHKVLFRPGATLKLTFAMEPLGPGEAAEPRPTPDETTRHDPRRPSRAYGRAEAADFGTLSLRVQPEDAQVLVDGEEWDRPEGEARFFIDLPEGAHRVEVRKEGYRTYSRTIQVRRGQTVTLNVSLTTGDPPIT